MALSKPLEDNILRANRSGLFLNGTGVEIIRWLAGLFGPSRCAIP